MGLLIVHDRASASTPGAHGKPFASFVSACAAQGLRLRRPAPGWRRVAAATPCFLMASPFFWRLRRCPDGFAISQTIAPRLRTPIACGMAARFLRLRLRCSGFTASPPCSRLAPCCGGYAVPSDGYAVILTASPPGRRSLLGSELRALAADRSLPASPPAVLRFTASPPCSRLSPCRSGYVAVLTASPSGRRSLLGSELRALAAGRSLPASSPAVLRFLRLRLTLPADAVSLAATPCFLMASPLFRAAAPLFFAATPLS